MIKRMFKGNGADLLLAGVAMLAMGLLLPGSSVGGCVATCANGCGMCMAPCTGVTCKCDKYADPPDKCNTCVCRLVDGTTNVCACLVPRTGT